jgi:hypothetical protein
VAAPTATPKDLNDCASLGLTKWSDWHRLRGRCDGEAGACDERGGNELRHVGFSWLCDNLGKMIAASSGYWWNRLIEKFGFAWAECAKP